MAKKSRTTEKSPSRARKAPAKRTTRATAKTAGNENAPADQATQQSAQETPAKPASRAKPAKKSAPPASSESDAQMPKPTAMATSATSAKTANSDARLTAQAEPVSPTIETVDTVSEVTESPSAAQSETPSMEEILASAQPVQEPMDEEPGYIPPPLANKYLNKEALRDRLWLRKAYMPIISYVGRLDFQKGVELIRHGIFYALEHGAQFVLLGTSPEHKINEEFWQLKRQLNDSPDCHLEIGFNEELSHLIYAGSDMMIMPSLYEPCGLAQMIALKYGTVPIVRWVGGLADTVFDKDYSHKPLHERNGYVFSEPDAQGLESAMYRAIGCWYSYPDDFRQLIINGMRYDYSWNYPGQHYLNIFQHIRCQ